MSKPFTRSQKILIVSIIVPPVVTLVAAFWPDTKSNQEETHVSSWFQSGGTTAGEVNVITDPPRVFSETLANELISRLDKNKTITVSAPAGDNEAFNLATQVKEFLQQNGYVVSGVDQVTYNPLFKGAYRIEDIRDNHSELRIGSK